MGDRLTIYDVFAVLVPGSVFIILSSITLDRLWGWKAFEWRGGFGDATVYLVTGYAAGTLLQAVAKLVSSTSVWQKATGGRGTVRLLLPSSTTCTEEFKAHVLDLIALRYGELPDPDDLLSFERALGQHARRLYKEVEDRDPTTARFFAEHDQMRAYVVVFGLLTLIALASAPVDSDHTFTLNLAVAAGFAGLCCLAFWRMTDKDDALAYHVLLRFSDKICAS